MQAVFGFIPYDGLPAIQHFRSDFFTAMCGQAVEHDRRRIRGGQDAPVQAIAREGRAAALGLVIPSSLLQRADEVIPVRGPTSAAVTKTARTATSGPRVLLDDFTIAER